MLSTVPSNPQRKLTNNTISILLTGKMRLRKIKKLAQDHPVCKWWNQVSTSNYLTLRTEMFTTVVTHL
jgi:hypothetical protein